MNIKYIYTEILKMYPSRIDVSDAELIMNVDGEGFQSSNFNDICENVEDQNSLKGEWYSLLTWVASQVLHEKAHDSFTKGVFEIDNTIDKKRFRELLINNLQQEGYQDMMNEFFDYEKENQLLYNW